MILDKIVAKKQVRLAKLKSKTPLDVLIKKAQNVKPMRRSFKQALQSHASIAIIGEIKKASPSKGLIKPQFNPKQLAQQYNVSDVQALSVLTEQDFFLGSPDYLLKAKAACNLPVLRKDFIIDTWQIYESYILGADAILLIVAILTDENLNTFYTLAKQLNLDVLIEVHSKQELTRAVNIGADIIGINNRNLHDFTVSLSTTERLISYIPSPTVIVSESGIFNHSDVARLKKAGAHALLIGESLMRAEDIPTAVMHLRSKK